jgi:AAA+ ATPase superfamily predicted ATPase
MVDFVGRRRELAALGGVLDEVRSGIGSSRPGQCLILRGRRRIGKSALVEEFLGRSGVPYVFYTAQIGGGSDALVEFADAVRASALPEADVFADAAPGNWAAALRQVAGILPGDRPSVVVVDEVPYLMDETGSFESVLQRAWDRELSRKPVLLVLIGSDLSMMEALTSYGRPFHQRGMDMSIGPLSPADIGAMTSLDPADAFDAAVVTGGLPIIAARWHSGEDIWSFLTRELANPVSPLLVSAQLSLAAEFPDHANLARAAGGISHSTLTRASDLLIEKRVVTGELPVSLRPSKERRYRLTDPYLRFWFAFLGQHLAEIDRMRSDLTLSRIRRSWTSWRGRAVEPLIRESLARMLPAHGIPAAPRVGSYWTRSNDVEIDIVGADRGPIAGELLFLGSIKWLENAPFDNHDLVSLQHHRDRVTSDPIPLIAVSRSGASTPHLDATLSPEDLLEGWR